MVIFTNFCPDPEFKYQNGWVLIATFVVTFLVGFAQDLNQFIRAQYLNCVKLRNKKLAAN